MEPGTQQRRALRDREPLRPAGHRHRCRALGQRHPAADAQCRTVHTAGSHPHPLRLHRPETHHLHRRHRTGHRAQGAVIFP